MSIDADTLFNALAHPLRLRALLLLQQEGELCVCELTHALGVSQPMISRHLAQLRQAGVVSDRRRGLWVYYRLHDALPEWAQQVLTATSEGIAGQGIYAADRAALAAMPDRPEIACCG
ncbi:metalloregulator ArsR/SmtB family transcription factor [Thiohalophilus sp.]|nr:metalloregulator ArsR/SmtB family transcription factor [Thiohalophilus sp.]MDZ7802703.1 metalloregulator ArsR/SmtB family transcription factor [Thiohalophilus sp.]